MQLEQILFAVFSQKATIRVKAIFFLLIIISTYVGEFSYSLKPCTNWCDSGNCEGLLRADNCNYFQGFLPESKLGFMDTNTFEYNLFDSIHANF